MRTASADSCSWARPTVAPSARRADHEAASASVLERGRSLDERGRCVREPELGRDQGERAGEPLGRHPHHGHGLARSTERRADHVRIGCETTGPEPMAEHGHGLTGRVVTFLRREPAPERGAHTRLLKPCVSSYPSFSLSSTAVVLRIIAARRELRRRSGRLSFAILVIQDIVVLAMLAILPALARWEGAGGADVAAPHEPVRWIDFVADAFLMIGGVAALVVVAKTVLPKLLRESLRGRRLEVMMLVGLAAALAAALVAQAIGFSLEMGAFLAGFVLSGTPFRHQLSGQIRPLRDIFSALFFTTVGMKVDPAAMAEGWWLILCAVAAVIIIKAVVISGVCWSAGAIAANAVIVGLALAQAGEFSLILIGEAADLGIFGAQLEASAITVVVISLILTPGLADLGRRLGRAATPLGHAPKSAFA